MKIDFKHEYHINNGVIETITVAVASELNNDPRPCTIEIHKHVNGTYAYFSNEYWLDNSDGDSNITVALTPEQLFDDAWLNNHGYYWQHP